MKQDKKRRNAVARILGAENKSEAIASEAKRAGVHPRTVERWVEGTKAALPDAGQPAVPSNAVPPGKTPENPVLDSLLKDEGAQGEPGEGPITPTEIAQGAADAERFCVEAFAGIKAAAGGMMVAWQYTPPLDAASPEVLKLLQVGKAAELAIRANAPRLYPILTRYASNWGALILAVGADAIGMVFALASLAKSKGWTPAPKKAKDRPEPTQVPSEERYGEQLRAAAQAAPVVKGEFGIVDAPLPTPEQIAAAEAVRQVVAG